MHKYFKTILVIIAVTPLLLITIFLVNWLVLIPAKITLPLYNWYYSLQNDKEYKNNQSSYVEDINFDEVVTLPNICDTDYSDSSCKYVVVTPNRDIYRIVNPDNKDSKLQKINLLNDNWENVVNIQEFLVEPYIWSFDLQDTSQNFEITTEKSIYTAANPDSTWKRSDLTDEYLQKRQYASDILKQYAIQKYFSSPQKALQPSSRPVDKTLISSVFLNIKQSEPARYNFSSITHIKYSDVDYLVWSDNRMRKFMSVELQCAELGCHFWPIYKQNYYLYLVYSNDEGQTWSDIHRVRGSEDMQVIKGYGYNNKMFLIAHKSRDYYFVSFSAIQY